MSTWPGSIHAFLHDSLRFRVQDLLLRFIIGADISVVQGEPTLNHNPYPLADRLSSRVIHIVASFLITTKGPHSPTHSHSRTLTPTNIGALKPSMTAYEAQQACKVAPACVVRPRHVIELSCAMRVLREEFDLRKKEGDGDLGGGILEIRSGSHSPVARASSIRGGALVDLSLFNEVMIVADRTSVFIGIGCKWGDVYKKLEERGLAVAGGRNSRVGVGGLTLGGGLSFLSLRFGMVCSNSIKYEVVLADGEVVKVLRQRILVYGGL
jgi:hypothetical protein